MNIKRNILVIYCIIITIVVIGLGVWLIFDNNKENKGNIIDNVTTKKVVDSSSDDIKVNITGFTKQELEIPERKFEYFAGEANEYDNTNINSDYVIISTISKYISDNHYKVYTSDNDNNVIKLSKEQLSYAIKVLWGNDISYTDKSVNCDETEAFYGIVYENDEYTISFPNPHGSVCEYSLSLDCQSNYIKRFLNSEEKNGKLEITFKVFYQVRDFDSHVLTIYEDDSKSKILYQKNDLNTPSDNVDSEIIDNLDAKVFKYYYEKIDNNYYIFEKKVLV